MNYKGLVIGLGNPGKQYDKTRHNCGFIFMDALLEKAARNGRVKELSGKKFFSRLWEVEMPELAGVWLCAEPQTFMNDSGRAARPLCNWFNIEPARLVVVQDELDIPAGSLRFKFGGGLAGHNGLKSIAQHLGTQDFYRMRIGIGKPAQKEEVLDWVLSRPAPEEYRKIIEIIPYALETLFIFSEKGGDAATAFAHAAQAKAMHESG